LGQTINPRQGQSFLGEPGAVLDGEMNFPYAFQAEAADVTVSAIEIRNYDSPPQDGAVQFAGGRNWKILGNEIHSNTSIGLRAGAGWQVVDNYLHHNGQFGMAGSGADILVKGNEIAFNNTLSANGTHREGGTKFTFTTDLVVEANYVHHNHGPGLWTDINNVGTLHIGNIVVDNDGPGIFHEISYNAIIQDNVSVRNGSTWTERVSGAGILVNTSSDVEISGNVVQDNLDGIGAIEQDRSGSEAEPLLEQWHLKNLYVHDNLIAMRVGHTGIVKSRNQPSDVFTSWNNVFESNDYFLPTGRTAFYEWSGSKDVEGWIEAGNDAHGTWTVTTGEECLSPM
jgi:hypothetical protein